MSHLFLDLDGTLTDPAPGITGCFQHAERCLGRAETSAAELRRFIGPPLREGLAELLETQDAALIEDAVRLYRERFSAIGLYENAVYPGIELALAELCNDGFQLCLVTSKPEVYANRILDHFELRRFFRSVYGAELSGEHSDKATLIGRALRGEAIHPSRACMIGDRSHDILGAAAHGVFSLGVTWGYGSREELCAAGADQLVSAVGDLAAVCRGVRPKGGDRGTLAS
ncbi:MAG TPA: HAD hydrolase-like protein [Polyangiaceae bacterium]|nr:HAD hydrolase-like protein [Polyangiaceae bacterium]